MVHYIFPVPIGEYNLSNHPDLKKLLDIINLPRLNRKHYLVKGGNSSFITDEDVLNFPEIKELKVSIQECINNYCNFLGFSPPLLTNSWFNILQKEGKVTPHHHEGSIISGAFYPLLEENSCRLIFHSPLNTFFHSFIPIERKKHFTKNKFRVPIKQNFLYLFPSTLLHETEKNKKTKRIVISFNSGYGST